MLSRDSLSRYWETRLTQNFNLRGVGHRRFSEAYNAHLFQAKTQAITEVLQKAEISLSNQRLLDAGCGTGFFIDYAHRQGALSLCGVDITQTSIRALQQRFPQDEFHQLSLGELPRMGWLKRFEGVAALDVLYCLVDDTDFDQALKGLAMSLKPGGWLLVSDRFFRIGFPQNHVRFRPWSVYQTKLKSLGLSFCCRHPLYVTLARSFIPLLGPWLLSPFGAALANADNRLRQRGDWVVRHLATLSLALFRKAS